MSSFHSHCQILQAGIDLFDVSFISQIGKDNKKLNSNKELALLLLYLHPTPLPRARDFFWNQYSEIQQSTKKAKKMFSITNTQRLLEFKTRDIFWNMHIHYSIWYH